MNWSELSTTRPMPRRILRVDAARILRRNDDRRIDLAGAHVFARLRFVVVIEWW